MFESLQASLKPENTAIILQLYFTRYKRVSSGISKLTSNKDDINFEICRQLENNKYFFQIGAREEITRQKNQIKKMFYNEILVWYTDAVWLVKTKIFGKEGLRFSGNYRGFSGNKYWQCYRNL